jgi:predicted metal-dependent phosphoesterase TrpH
MAADAGVKVVSLTDHDTVAGQTEARAAATGFGMRYIPGIEISTRSRAEQHILGYGIDVESERLSELCGDFIRLREERAARTLAFLKDRGIDLTMEEIRSCVHGAYIGRPHIAEALVRRGVVRTRKEAFDRYLATAAFQKIERPKPTAEAGIRAIKDAGGKAVLAHPHSLNLPPEGLERALRDLASIGLDGMECYYTGYAQERIDEYTAIARRLGLLITGGSDFHGPQVKPGTVIGGAGYYDTTIYEILIN